MTMELKKNYFFYELHIIQMGQLLGILTHATKMEEGCFAALVYIHGKKRRCKELHN